MNPPFPDLGQDARDGGRLGSTPFVPGADGRHAPRFVHVKLIVLMWCVVAVLNFALSSVNGFHADRTIVSGLTAVCGCLLSLALHGVTRRLRHPTERVSLVFTAVLLAVAGSVLWLANTLLQAWTSGHTPIGGWPSDWFLQVRMSWTYFTALFVLQTIIVALLDSFRTLQARERQLLEARLAALRFQLNPHFLFNSLNAIAALVAESRASEAEEMINRLALFFRSSLSGEQTELVPLAGEMEMVQSYLDIEFARFGDRLAVRYACEPGLADAQVPSLILQPLIENAVKYAVAPSKEQVTVSIGARTVGADLVLVVEDDGCHASNVAGGTGVGLRNVAARLDALYGAAGRIDADKRERGFVNVIRLPLRRIAC